jgi:hypothetical protein
MARYKPKNKVQKGELEGKQAFILVAHAALVVCFGVVAL